ncbi:DUF2000 domain-containing protein [Bacillus sp. CLL-7-23]|uniref:DUF2000 domain-containing protein n=1 Tax=Bacillus changyiensis TaxID=3004103 RepID=A0ABT4X811_9BACI|nr:DUF2000 domain-containing protein [Bacillus changyiensis]MDA7028427.1 DUF2000 domain-containing protein [Bacillus changyiensis]
MEMKCVIVIDSTLPTGLIANTAAVLALTLGRKVEGIIGPEVLDASNRTHEGITTIPIPILKSNKTEIKELKHKVDHEDLHDLLVVDFSNAAQTTKNYEDYTKKIATIPSDDLDYLGIALYGEKKKVNKLTGSMGLLR